MKIILITILFFLSTITPATAQLYQWTDDKGTVHMTDNVNRVPAEMRKKDDEPAQTQKAINWIFFQEGSDKTGYYCVTNDKEIAMKKQDLYKFMWTDDNGNTFYTNRTFNDNHSIVNMLPYENRPHYGFRPIEFK